MTTIAATTHPAWVPPHTGFHAIIGPEGVGKTHLLTQLPTTDAYWPFERLTGQAQDLVRANMRLAFPHESFLGYDWPDTMSARSPGVQQLFGVLSRVIARDAGTIAAFDNIETGMSPRTIRVLFIALREFRRRAKEDVTFVFTTQSSCVLNEFNRPDDEGNEGPGNVWIISKRGGSPRRITDLWDRDQLAQHHLGELHENGRLLLRAHEADHGHHARG